jgi:hypothetical protein
MLVLVGWVIFLAIFYSSYHEGAWQTRWHFGFEEAIVSFFSAGTPMMHDEKLMISFQKTEYVVVVCLAVILGFVHIGVFISHLYSSISRR